MTEFPNNNSSTPPQYNSGNTPSPNPEFPSYNAEPATGNGPGYGQSPQQNNYAATQSPYGNQPYQAPPMQPAGNPAATVQPQSFQPVAPMFAQQGNQSTSMSVTSLILGIVSIFMGCLIFLPVIGLILGFFGIGKEPNGKVMAIIGVVLNGLVLLGWGTFVLLALLDSLSRA